LRFRHLGILDGRKSRRAQQRIRQRTILCPQPRHFALEQPDVPPLQQPLKKITHVHLFAFTVRLTTGQKVSYEENPKEQKATREEGRKKRIWNQLEKATAASFASLSGEALKEENRLGAALGEAASHVNFDE
jgi:hypothetical protein